MDTFRINRQQEQEGLFAALQNPDICTFWYFPQEKLITVNERTARIYQCKRIYTNMPKSFADDFVHPDTQAPFYEMYCRIDAGERTAQASFSSRDLKNWCTVTLTTISYDMEGRPAKTYGIVQNISELKLREAEYHSSRRMLSGIIEALGNIYMFNYYIDLETMEFTQITGLDYITDILGASGDAVRAFEIFTDTLIDESCRESFRAFVDVRTLADRIGDRQNISLEYSSIRKGWCRASFIVVSRDASRADPGKRAGVFY